MHDVLQGYVCKRRFMGKVIIEFFVINFPIRGERQNDTARLEDTISLLKIGRRVS